MRKNCKHILVIRQLPLTIRIANIVIKTEFTKFIEIKIAVGYITLPQIATLSLYPSIRSQQPNKAIDIQH